MIDFGWLLISMPAITDDSQDDSEQAGRHHQGASVLSIGIFNAGNRQNIIPDKAEMQGTLRTFEEGITSSCFWSVST